MVVNDFYAETDFSLEVCPLYKNCRTGQCVAVSRCREYKQGCATFRFYNEYGITWSDYCLQNSIKKNSEESDAKISGNNLYEIISHSGNCNGHSNGNGSAKKERRMFCIS